MWRELIEDTNEIAELADPATTAGIEAAESQLGQTLPADLKALLLETNGVTDQYGTDLVWSAERIASENTAFRTDPNYVNLYMPFGILMFFGDNGGGDQFAFVRTPERGDIFVWDHETDSRQMVAGSLEQYLVRSLQSDGEAWYRD